MLQIFLVKILQHFWRLLWGGYQRDFGQFCFDLFFCLDGVLEYFLFSPVRAHFFMVDDDKMRSCHFYHRVCISEIIFLSSANIINICGIKHRSKAKNTLLSFFETVLNVGFRKVCSGTCVVCGLSAGDLDCLVFNRAFFAVTILVNATWTGKMIIVLKIVFHEINFNPNLILNFLLLYDDLKKLWTIDKQFSDIKEKASMGKSAEKVWWKKRGETTTWCGGVGPLGESA